MVWRPTATALALVLSAGCAARAPLPTPAPAETAVPRIEYSVQLGAFASPDNALRLVASLAERELEAFHFAGEDGLHRVRFGSFESRELARRRAEALRQEGIIEQYFVVSPSLAAGRGDAALRSSVVRSATGFLGRPYRWGGSSAETGLDCSGLTMTAYRLNGVALPRSSADQFALGAPVSLSELREADLVFFADEGGTRATHVGLYLGEGRFIHAPRSGDVVRVDALSNGHYERRFLGGRSYLSEP